MKRIIKITLIVTSSLVVLYIGFVGYVKFTNPHSSLFIDYRYNKVIIEPLAKIGYTNAQVKMGVFCFYSNLDYPDIILKEDLEKAVYWWEKAANKGNEWAIEELARVEQMLAEGKHIFWDI